MNLFWDSCVLIRYLTREPNEHLGEIDQLIADAQKGTVRIHMASIMLAEVRPSHIKQRPFASVSAFVNDFQRGFRLIEPSPIIMARAGELRDARPILHPEPSARKIKGAQAPKQRVIGTADAIHLMTALYVRDTLGVSDLQFQTFDSGKGANWEGKCVPLLGFEDWFPDGYSTAQTNEVSSLERCRPYHPRPDFATVASRSNGHDVKSLPRP